MSSNSSILSGNIEAKLDDATTNFNLLEELIAEYKSKSIKLDADRDDLEAARLDLRLDRLELEAKMLELGLNGGGACILDTKLGSERAALKAERAQLEAEKFQLRIGQSQLKAAQSQLEDAKSQLELAQSQLDGARVQLETAWAHLEAAKAQVVIDGKRLEAASINLEAAKLRFVAATKQMNAAKKRFESAKSMLDASTSKNDKNDDKVTELLFRISQLEAGISKCDSRIAQLENQLDKCSEDGAQIDNEEQRRLREEVTELKIQLIRSDDEKKAMQVEIDKWKQASVGNPKILPPVRIYGKPKVYFDITDRGMAVGRLVFELDTYKYSHGMIDIFRALCTGEKGVDSEGVPVHFKGTTITRRMYNDYIIGGGDETLGLNCINEIVEYNEVGNLRLHETTRFGNGDLIVPYAPRPDERCLFFIITDYSLIYLPEKYVKIGRVVSSEDLGDVMNFIAKRSLSYSDWLRNKASLVIADCGEL